MRIEKERIEAVKHGVDLVALIRSKGIELKKNGKGYFGLCPFHEDNNPSLSVNPGKNLWRCFGCGAAGDAIRFVELFDKITFPEAVDQLMADSAQPFAKKTTIPIKQDKLRRLRRPALSVKEKKLLARVVSYYQHTPGRR